MYHPYFQFTNGGAVPPTPPVAPSHLTWGSYARCSRLFRGHRISEEVCEAIEEIAQALPEPIILADTGKPSAYVAKQTLAQQEAMLRAELKAQNIAWRKIYREALAALIDQQNEDEAICMLLCEM